MWWIKIIKSLRFKFNLTKVKEELKFYLWRLKHFIHSIPKMCIYEQFKDLLYELFSIIHKRNIWNKHKNKNLLQYAIFFYLKFFFAPSICIFITNFITVHFNEILKIIEFTRMKIFLFLFKIQSREKFVKVS